MEDVTEQKSSSFRKVGLASFCVFSGLCATLAGFSYGLSSAKKSQPGDFAKAEVEGTKLAFRALRWGTFCSILGVGGVCAAVLAATGARNAKEFNDSLRRAFPKFPKKEPQGRSEFESVQDLVDYIVNDGGEGNGDKKT